MWADICKFGTVSKIRGSSGSVKKSIIYGDPVPCKKSSVSRDEFYKAAMTDYEPAAMVTVKRCEYNDEHYLKIDEIEYTIIRAYVSNKRRDDIELTVQRGISTS